jgi:hypothetical protein
MWCSVWAMTKYCRQDMWFSVWAMTKYCRQDIGCSVWGMTKYCRQDMWCSVWAIKKYCRQDMWCSVWTEQLQLWPHYMMFLFFQVTLRPSISFIYILLFTFPVLVGLLQDIPCLSFVLLTLISSSYLNVSLGYHFFFHFFVDFIKKLLILGSSSKMRIETT